MNAKALLVGLLAITMAGCATVPRGRPVSLDFLIDGKTAREEVAAKLGEPSAKFEEGKILTYRLGTNARCGDYLVFDRDYEHPSAWPPTAADPLPHQVPDWYKAKRSLVLVFDDQNVLRRHSLVEVAP